MSCFACKNQDGTGERLLYSNPDYIRVCNECTRNLRNGQAFSVQIDTDIHSRLMFRMIHGQLHFAITRTGGNSKL